MSIYETLPSASGSTSACLARRDRRPGQIGAASRRAVGRGQGQAGGQRPEPVGRPAAASVHRPHRGGEAGGDPVRRAVLGARSDLDCEDRGADRRAEGRTTRSSSSPTTCNRRRGSPTSPPSCISASWSSSAPRPRSSPRPGTSGRRHTSPVASADLSLIWRRKSRHGGTYPSSGSTRSWSASAPRSARWAALRRTSWRSRWWRCARDTEIAEKVIGDDPGSMRWTTPCRSRRSAAGAAPADGGRPQGHPVVDQDRRGAGAHADYAKNNAKRSIVLAQTTTPPAAVSGYRPSGDAWCWWRSRTCSMPSPTATSTRRATCGNATRRSTRSTPACSASC